MVWLPFELHPEIPPEGMPRERYFSPGRTEQMAARLREMAAEVGLKMQTRDRLINTRLALATAEFARERGAFDAVHKALFKAHWEGLADLDSVEDLKRIVAEAGLDPAELGEALAAGRYEEALDANRREAVAVGINAIPAHIFARRFLVVGAQPDEVFDQVLGKVAEVESAEEGSPG